MEKKILIAIDGSVYSDQALSYTASIFRNQNNVSFHLLTCISSISSYPESIDSNNTLFPESPTQKKNIGVAHLRIKKATQKLFERGISENRLTSSVIYANANIGTVIQNEAEKLLVDAVIIGRRGIGRIGEMLMGSVSATLFQKCHSIPLWIIDGEVKSDKFLVPMDRTIHSLLAIDHLAHIFSDRADITFYLFHCHLFFGKRIHKLPKTIHKKWRETWDNTKTDNDGFLSYGPVQLLIQAGIKKEKIVILPATTNLEESYSIIRQATKLNCGTIVMGRRGVGMGKGLFGGVSDRTFDKTENMALWVVG